MDELEKLRFENARLTAMLDSNAQIFINYREQNDLLRSIIQTLISNGK